MPPKGRRPIASTNGTLAPPKPGRGRPRKSVAGDVGPKPAGRAQTAGQSAASAEVGQKRKRGRLPGELQALKDNAKRARLDHLLEPDARIGSGGVILALGQGDTGQLGLGEDILERSKPALVKNLTDVVCVVAGGMHSVALTHKGRVWTFGCNDEGALGRATAEDEACYTPGLVTIPGRVVQISAGDSHTVALTETGQAFYWGTFRDSSGSFGLTQRGIEALPVPLAPELNVKKIASGSDHVALLTDQGELYTLGCAEQGQLGRVGERFVARGGRRGLDLLLTPDRVHAPNRKIDFINVWAGSYATYALTSQNEVMVCGLNNYNQLGIERGQMFFTLKKSDSFSRVAQSVGWSQIAPGQHHTIALDSSGTAYAIGRVEYGRLGLGEQHKDDALVPTPIPALKNLNVVNVSAGTAVSFALADSGVIYSWGMGTNGQLGHEDDEDAWEPRKMLGKQLETRQVLVCSGGGQHTIMTAKDK